MKLKWIAVLALGLLAMGFQGCVAPSLPEDKPCVLDELRLGDPVTVTFSDLPLNSTIPDQKIRVNEDGTLSLPMNVSVVAAGKSVAVVQKELVALYRKYFNQVTVTIKTDDRYYSVGGEVRNPGRQLYLGPTTILRALQSCGDFTDFANQHKVEIHRADGRIDIIDCKKARKDHRWDVRICPGDAIIVPRRLA